MCGRAEVARCISLYIIADEFRLLHIWVHTILVGRLHFGCVCVWLFGDWWAAFHCNVRVLVRDPFSRC